MERPKKLKYGLIDSSGREIARCKYDQIYDFQYGVAVVVINRKYGLVDTYGREIVPCVFDEIDYFSEGYIKVKLQNKWGIMAVSTTK